ncbi:hypothetical protein GEMRC1_007639 [Eukaryota sp. GEM-RC1]
MARLTLISGDGQKFDVDSSVGELCGYIRNIVDASGDTEIPVPGVCNVYMKRALDFAHFHAKVSNSPDSVTDDEIISWNRKFIIDVDLETVFQTLLAGNFLGMPALIDLCCKTIANLASDKTPEQLREQFNIPQDFDTKELESLKAEFNTIFG